jgi:hypothetical protein
MFANIGMDGILDGTPLFDGALEAEVLAALHRMIERYTSGENA